ncbi:hypothetical protein M3Y99_00767000 [Aphelenchoides fujianensis]|nr:hypothetical protein M3Y99_00767000 [Aphelenchoides fujianensis]
MLRIGIFVGLLVVCGVECVRQPKAVYSPKGERILPFYAANYPYSNHYVTDITIDKNVFYSTEQYYFYRKAQIFGDKFAERKLLKERDPMKAKEIGRNVRNFDQHKWDAVSFTIMKRAIFEKFKQHRRLKAALLATRGTLVEAAPKDYRWGVGLSVNDPSIQDPTKWRGTNYLGRALMEVRTGLKNGADKRSPDIGLRKKGPDGRMYRIFYSKRNYFHAFYPTEVLYLDGRNFHNAQNFFAYTKARTFGDNRMAKRILAEPSGRQAQILSFQLSTFDAKKWDAKSFGVMKRALKAKFFQNLYLKKALKETGNDVLVFADDSNLRWSAGVQHTSPKIADPSAWKGKNLLGDALMQVRSSL